MKSITSRLGNVSQAWRLAIFTSGMPSLIHFRKSPLVKSYLFTRSPTIWMAPMVKTAGEAEISETSSNDVKWKEIHWPRTRVKSGGAPSFFMKYFFSANFRSPLMNREGVPTSNGISNPTFFEKSTASKKQRSYFHEEFLLLSFLPEKRYRQRDFSTLFSVMGEIQVNKFLGTLPKKRQKIISGNALRQARLGPTMGGIR